MLALLNTSIVTCYGTYEYKYLTLEDAKKIIQNDFVSYIGHQSTCNILSNLLQVEIPMNRNQYKQHVGDEALIFQLKKRIKEGQVLSSIDQIEAIGYKFGLLKRIK
ncbi:MAG: YddF family protein [Chitinophagales bacterium]|nr:YddF family protein [Chitinophagales bacterium]